MFKSYMAKVLVRSLRHTEQRKQGRQQQHKNYDDLVFNLGRLAFWALCFLELLSCGAKIQEMQQPKV